MKYCISFLVSLSALLVSSSVLAAEKLLSANAPLAAKSVSKNAPGAAKHALENSPISNNKIFLYSQPTTHAQPVEQIPPQVKLIEIYRQNNWVKVGDPTNGKVGWLTDIAYQVSQTSVAQIVFLQIKPGNNSTENIVAYRNGQKLSEADAKKIYTQLSQQQTQFNQQIVQFQNSMNQLMTQFDNSAIAFSLIPIMPSVVVIGNKQ